MGIFVCFFKITIFVGFCGIFFSVTFFNISSFFFSFKYLHNNTTFLRYTDFFFGIASFFEKKNSFSFLAKHRQFEIFFEKSGFYHNVWGCFFSREKGKSGYDGTDDNHQIRVVICTVFFYEGDEGVK